MPSMKSNEIIGPAFLLCLKNVGILIAGFVCLLAVGLWLPNQSGPPIPFDSEVWKRQEDGNERLRMVSDLKPKLMGISKKQVEGMLGEPRKDVAGLYAGYDYTYLLGTTRMFFWPEDGIWLCIKFENSCVRDVLILHGK